MNDLERFVQAQRLSYPEAVRELRAGRKRSHWMWFVFPQLRALGHSPMAIEYGIGSLEEAQGYLAHDVLGPRLRECTQLVLQAQTPTAATLMGPTDAHKLRSSMTLFAAVADGDFVEVLAKYFSGKPDPVTSKLLDQQVC